jgi:3',5'-cyclic AMP phosphodiesterase CpdA
MLIAQLSDLHIAAKGKEAYNLVPTDRHLATCVQHINTMVPQPDIVLVTGDITYSGLTEEAKYAKKLLDKLEIPYFIVPGNHDVGSVLADVFASKGWPDRQGNFFNYAVDNFAIRLLAVDSTFPGEAGGKICTSRADWLAARLAEQPLRPTLIFMHHPPLKFGVLETDEDGFTGADILGKLVTKSKNVLALLCGHIHIEAHACWHGTVVSTAPSMGLQLSLDLTLKHPSAFYLSTPGYQLHFYTEQQNLVTHTVYSTNLDGPYLFEEH